MGSPNIGHGTPDPPKVFTDQSWQYRGKGLGGTSSVNTFLFHRPSAMDINGAASHKIAMALTYLSIAVKHLKN